jgi:D-alanyl-D-alanine-carboxypeptidase/D-alanyl-D-alanine-endopeptidase
LPDHNTGLFAFTNRTYTAPGRLVMQAAQDLLRAELLAVRTLPVSAPLAGTYRAAGEVYQAGTIAPAQSLLAMNFLMDRSPENWARELALLRDQAGACRTDTPIIATGALAGQFQWQCERGPPGWAIAARSDQPADDPVASPPPRARRPAMTFAATRPHPLSGNVSGSAGA